MTKFTLCAIATFLLSASFAFGQQVDAPASLNTAGSVAEGFSAVRLVDYDFPDTGEFVEPPTLAEPAEVSTEEIALQRLPPSEGFTLESLEQMALANSPTMAQAAARVRALRGKWVQVGLAPNPTMGYLASEIGNEGAAGQQGGFVGQDFVTGKKLQRNRAIIAAEISGAEQEVAAVRRRIQTDVRQGYYGALLAQRRVELADELVRLTSQAADASKSLVDAEEIPLAGLLQTEMQQQNAEILLTTAQNRLAQAWRILSALVGGPEMSIQSLEGDVSELPESLDWNEQLVRLQTQSPEVAIAMAGVDRARRVLRRACVEAVPDVSTQLSVQYDNATDDTIAGVQIGLPLPLWNRNQGGIRQARAEVTEAIRNVDRVELNLNQRLAAAFRQYSDARATEP